MPTETAVEPAYDSIELLAIQLLRYPQLDCPLVHRFAPGVYLRQVVMPKGSLIIGHKHKTEHFNIILSGKARVMMEGKIHNLVGPCVVKSGVGVRKVLLIEEDTTWMTVHPTDETDVEKLEEELVIKNLPTKAELDLFEAAKNEMETLT